MSNLKEAKFYKKLPNKNVQCLACNRFCLISENQVGFCKVRKNINGKLFSLVYGYPVAINIEPIEKKPLYHFLPKTKTLSLGTFGCNFGCSFCQNHDIAIIKQPLNLQNQNYVFPKEIISLAKENDISSISYTYTEPTVFSEYALDIMKLAKKESIKNIWVSNGYMSNFVLKRLYKYLDAINIDYKGDKTFYKNQINNAQQNVVKRNIKKIYKHNIHLELTYLLLENYNTSKKQIKEFVKFVYDLDKNIPIHFSRAFGYYKLSFLQPTNLETLNLAKEIAIKKGLKHVYLGNI